MGGIRGSGVVGLGFCRGKGSCSCNSCPGTALNVCVGRSFGKGRNNFAARGIGLANALAGM